MFGIFGKVTDPVCKMEINKKDAKFSIDFDGQKYYFCSQNCKNKFDASPKKNAAEGKHTEGCCS